MKKDYKKLTIILIIMVCLAAAMLVCSKLGKQVNNADYKTELENTGSSENEKIVMEYVENEDKENIIIETPYINLLYPGKNAAFLQTVIDEDEICTVEFYCAFSDEEKCHLFDILLGEKVESFVGTIVNENDMVVQVGVKYYDIEKNKEYSTEQMEVLYLMQEDLNYILENLSMKEWE